MTTKQHNSEYEEEELVSPMEGIDEVTSSEDKRQVESDPKKNIYTSRHSRCTYPPDELQTVRTFQKSPKLNQV